MISLSCSFNFSNHCTLVCNEMILKSLCNLRFFLGMPILLKIIFLELTADTKYLFDIFNASFIVYKLVHIMYIYRVDEFGSMIQIVHRKECLYTTSTKYVLGMSRVKTQPEGALVNVTQPKKIPLTNCC